ncbi:hypothetical protein [Agrobacterium rosae]|uniref:hypothetical protein n=1 Tax=Agrobacterium rosae TaxID=1972867 RepID=UPI003BA089C5
MGAQALGISLEVEVLCHIAIQGLMAAPDRAEMEANPEDDMSKDRLLGALAELWQIRFLGPENILKAPAFRRLQELS